MAIKTDLKDLLLFWEVKPSEVPALIDQIVTLFEVEKDGQRCEWTRQIEDNHEYYTTSCDLVDLAYHTYCPKCGKRIELQPKRNLKSEENQGEE